VISELTNTLIKYQR